MCPERHSAYTDTVKCTTPLKKKKKFHNIMVPSVVKLAQAKCSRDTPRHLQLIRVGTDANLCPENSTNTVFKQHSVSTINSALIFNGNICHVRKGQSWIKMHHYFSQSVTYTMCKQ